MQVKVQKVVNNLILRQIAVGYLIAASIDTFLTVEEYIKRYKSTLEVNAKQVEEIAKKMSIL